MRDMPVALPPYRVSAPSTLCWSAKWLCLIVVWLWAAIAHAGPVQPAVLDPSGPESGPLGLQSAVMVEEGERLQWADVAARLAVGQGERGTASVLTFGIGAKPVWIRLQVHNASNAPIRRQLLVGVTWTDSIDAYVVADGQVLSTWRTGDERRPAIGVSPAMGYAHALDFPPGHSELYVRVECIDPMVVPMELLAPDAYDLRVTVVKYAYGVFYGFLIALAAYNAMLYLGLRETSHLYYAFYLLCLIALNLAYTGHGLAWIWPGHAGLQRYVILMLMILFGYSGLVFASRFLELSKHVPKGLFATRVVCMLALVLFSLAVWLNSHLAAVIVAFGFFGIFLFTMVWFGVLSVGRGHVAGRYFLVAVVCGMLGGSAIFLVNLGVVPYSFWTFRSLEMGISLEATLLALALAYQMRQHQQASLKATYLANHDPLTDLHNRRGFMDRARAAWSTAARSQRSLSLILLDLDHFKQINDVHGHDVGDQALVTCARLLASAGRAGDVLARWGGEEFILLLPDTDLDQACALAERLRLALGDCSIDTPKGPMHVTASFGVAQREEFVQLEGLIRSADQALYQAKRAGRNRVMVPEAGSHVQSSLFNEG